MRKKESGNVVEILGQKRYTDFLCIPLTQSCGQLDAKYAGKISFWLGSYFSLTFLHYGRHTRTLGGQLVVLATVGNLLFKKIDYNGSHFGRSGDVSSKATWRHHMYKFNLMTVQGRSIGFAVL
jgi:hypothetical protein